MNDTPRILHEDEQLFAQLFTCLTTRWCQRDGSLAIGAPESRLLDALNTSHDTLERILEQLQTQLTKLGIELVRYYLHDETWYCLRSIFTAPNELTIEEQAVLATIVALIENERKEHHREIVKFKILRDKLVKGDYMRPHKLRQILSTLKNLGFIQRSAKGITYGPRTLIELRPETREELHTEVLDILL